MKTALESEALKTELRSHLFYAATVAEGCEVPNADWCESASRACNEAAAYIDELEAELGRKVVR